MRLICPKCTAHYEVEAAMIPQGGRDVQCSACGNVWFQPAPTAAAPPTTGADATVSGAPGAPAVSARPMAPRPAAQPDLTQPDPVPPAGTAPPATAPSPAASAPTPTPSPAIGDDDDLDEDGEIRGPALDPNLIAMLREEAARELGARETDAARRAAGGLEVQPELGLDMVAPPPPSPPPSPPSSSPLPRPGAANPPAPAVASDTTAPAAITGAAVAPPLPRRVRPAAGRDLLPDIEGINSTLAASSALRHDGSTVPATPPVARRNGFRVGFLVALLAIVMAMTVYAQAPRLMRSQPALAPVLGGYVALVDQGRAALDRLADHLHQRLVD